MTKRYLKAVAASAAMSVALLTPQASQAGLLGNAINKAINSHGNGPVWTENAGGFKGVTQVVLGQFSVVFLTKKVDYAGGGFLATSGNAKVIGQLSGLSAADYQRITDSIYADFQKKLAASGVTVADPSAYHASKYYQSVTSQEQGHSVTVPLQDKDNGDGVIYWPTALPNHENIALPLRFMDMSMGKVYTAQYAYAREAKIPVLNVVYVVDFAEPATTSGARMLQGVKITSQVAVSTRGTQLYLTDTNGKPAKISLNQPLVEDGAFAEIKDITSKLQKGAESAQMVGNLLGAFGGHGSNMLGKQMRMDRRFEFNVSDPANYGDLVTHAGGQANDLLMASFAGLRARCRDGATSRCCWTTSGSCRARSCSKTRSSMRLCPPDRLRANGAPSGAIPALRSAQACE